MCIRTYVEENIEKYSGLTTWTLSFPQSSSVLPRFRHRWLQCLTRKSPGGPPVPGSGFQMWSACMSRAAHLELHMYSYTKQKKKKNSIIHPTIPKPDPLAGQDVAHTLSMISTLLQACYTAVSRWGERHAQHMDSWAVQQMSHWGEFSSGQGNTSLKPVHMTCWGFTEQVGGGRRTSWSPGASPEEAGAHVEAPLSHPVITPSLFLILGYSGGALHDCSSPKTM